MHPTPNPNKTKESERKLNPQKPRTQLRAQAFQQPIHLGVLSVTSMGKNSNADKSKTSRTCKYLNHQDKPVTDSHQWTCEHNCSVTCTK
jgi:hypothetical protein